MDMTTGMAVSWDDVKAYCRQNNIPFIKCLCDAKIKIFRPITGDHEGRYIGMCDARRKRDRCGFFSECILRYTDATKLTFFT